MDKLKKTDFLESLHGRVFLTSFEAVQTLTPEVV
jgi:hypothetical protein